MIKNILFCLLFLISTCLLGQKDYAVSYYPYINNAEIAIIEDKYELALKHYSFAFSFVGNGFARDYLNAVYCAIETKNYSTAIRYLEKLVAKGVPRRYFNRDKNLEALKGQGLENFLNNFESIYETTFRTTENRKIYGRLGQMENLEQEFRLDFQKYRDTIIAIDRRNAYELNQIIEDNGFHTEEMLGVENPFSPRIGYYHLILIHGIKNWRADSITFPNFIFPIKEAMKQGRLSNQIGSEYLDIGTAKVGRIGNYGSTEAITFGDDDQLYMVTYAKQEQDQINLLRREIGLCSLYDYERKMVYHYDKQKGKPKYKLLNNGFTTSYPGEAKGKIMVKPL